MDSIDNRTKVMFVDDEPEALELFEVIYSSKYDLVLCSSGADAIEKAKATSDIAVVVMDIRMPGMDGVEAMREVRKLLPDAEGIFHTAFAGEYDEDEIDASEKPYEFVLKGEASSRLDRALRNSSEKYHLKRNNHWLVDRARRDFGLIGCSEAMRRVYSDIINLSERDTKILLLGETGTGKTAIAEKIHTNSQRADNKFVAYPCSERPHGIIESELFGHCKGAFTGADRDKMGLFEYADGGTFLLDEIADLSLTIQSTILKIIDRGLFNRVGDEKERSCDIRLIAATNRDIKALVESGAFREDLYYRIEGVVVTLPPLRERVEDIKPLVDHFIRIIAHEDDLPPLIVHESAYDAFESYRWPGNVRQLYNVIKRIETLTSFNLITGNDVRKALDMDETGGNGQHLDFESSMRRCERRTLLYALRRSGFVVADAARMLGITRQTFFRKIKDHKIDVKALRDDQSESGE